MLPSYGYPRLSTITNKEEYYVRVKEKEVCFDKILVSKKSIDKSILIGVKNGNRLLIRIAIKRLTREKELERIKKSNIACVEIDLRDYYRNGVDIENLKSEIISKSKNKKWIYNSKFEKELDKWSQEIKENEKKNDVESDKYEELFYNLRHRLTRK